MWTKTSIFMHFVRISFENVTLCLTLAFIFFKTFKPLIFFNHEQKIKNQGLLRTKNQFQVCFQGFEIGLLKFKGFQDVYKPSIKFIYFFIYFSFKMARNFLFSIDFHLDIYLFLWWNIIAITNTVVSPMEAKINAHGNPC